MANWSAAEVVSGTGDAAFASYESGRVAGWNQAAQDLLGYSPDEVIGVPSETLLFDRNELRLRHQLGAEPAARFHVQARHSDGRRLPLGVSVVRLPRPAGTSSLLLHIMVPEESYPASAHAVASTKNGPGREAAEVALTPRETEVLRLLADGKPAQVVAGVLFISLTTVRTHIRNILQKCQVHSQLEAVAVAFRRELI